jgi:DNA-binding transcriptional LysR family regulator
MEFKQLEMFVALAESRSVQRAAERVYRSQPAVSMAIAKLEQELGAPLFARRDGFRLTEGGKVLYEYASRIIQLRDEALKTLTAPFGAVRGTSGLDRCGRLAGFKEAK